MFQKTKNSLAFWKEISASLYFVIKTFLSKIKPLKFIKQKSKKKNSNKSHNNNDKKISVPQYQR
jgi:hypothetical protein